MKTNFGRRIYQHGQLLEHFCPSSLLLFLFISQPRAFDGTIENSLLVSVFGLAVVLENHEVTDEDVDPPMKRQRIEINCQDPSIKVVAPYTLIRTMQLIMGR